MSYEAYDAFEDLYAYPGTTVLINRLDLRNQADLEAFELEISTLRSEEPLPEGDFDPAHYRKVHHHLFQDVYEWAGQYRMVRTSKGGNMFCFPGNIPAQMDVLFGKLRAGEIFNNQSADQFIAEIARFLGDLNAIHPSAKVTADRNWRFSDCWERPSIAPLTFRSWIEAHLCRP